jgi:hypothetical protein
MKLPNPPLALIVLTLAYFAFETWLLLSNPVAGRVARYGLVAALIVGVLYENRVVVPIWMIACLFMALFLLSNAFETLDVSYSDFFLSAAGALLALCNTGYLFFFHGFRRSTNNGNA